MIETGLGVMFGAFLPPLISFLKQRHWPVWAKMVLTIGLSLVAGAVSSAIDGTVNFNGDLIHDPEGLLAAAAAAFTSATVIYRTFFRDTNWNDTLTGP